jgi:protein-S-isoprenylcysteine O-methyltransferase Ste14
MLPRLLIAAQIVLAALLVLSARWRPIPWTLLLVMLPGIGLAAAACLKIGLRNVRMHPASTENTRLITEGPYRIVRHPMYTGLLWLTAVLLFDPFRFWRLTAWFALLTVLYVKSIYEERSMSTRFEDYGRYQQRVGRLLPRIRADGGRH